MAPEPATGPTRVGSVVVKVASPSFSADPILRSELLALFPQAVLNERGERFDRDSLITYLGAADAAIIGLERVDARVLDACPRLRIVAKFGVGLDNVDVAGCAARGVAVGWTPGVNRRSVAELALCFLLGLFRNVFVTSSLLRQGQWLKRGGRELSSATVGVIGLGNTGSELVKLLQPFGCRILANDVADVSQFCATHRVTHVDKPVLFAESDAVSLHVPLTESTRLLIRDDTIRLFRPGAFLVNTSRGEVVDRKAVKQALASGQLGGAALDVFDVEPPTDRELLEMRSFVGTPHIGGNSREAVLAMGRSAIRHLAEFYAPAETTA